MVCSQSEPDNPPPEIYGKGKRHLQHSNSNTAAFCLEVKVHELTDRRMRMITNVAEVTTDLKTPVSNSSID